MIQKFLVLVVLSFFLVNVEKACAGNVNLEWSASTSSNVVGYYVYYGTSSGNYLSKIDAGSATSVTISNLTCGITYYFVATAYDVNGDESPFSSELSFLTPGILKMNKGSGGGGLATLTFPVTAGHWYELQATTDLKNWSSIWQSTMQSSNLWLQCADPYSTAFASRFYRLVTH